jgi:hypothetical protein
MGHVIAGADSLVSRNTLAKSVMELKLGAPGASVAYAASTLSRVRVRSAANLQGEAVGFLEEGDRVQVLEKSADTMNVGDMTDYWYRVRRVSLRILPGA